MFKWLHDIKSAISKHASDIYDIKRWITYSFGETYDVLSTRIKAVDHANASCYQKTMDLEYRITQIEQSLSCTEVEDPDTTTLKQQVECGATGHDFKLDHISNQYYWYTLFANGTCSRSEQDPYKGVFKCTKCGLEITRELKPAEVTAAKKLGLI